MNIAITDIKYSRCDYCGQMTKHAHSEIKGYVRSSYAIVCDTNLNCYRRGLADMGHTAREIEFLTTSQMPARAS